MAPHRRRVQLGAQALPPHWSIGHKAQHGTPHMHELQCVTHSPHESQNFQSSQLLYSKVKKQNHMANLLCLDTQVLLIKCSVLCASVHPSEIGTNTGWSGQQGRCQLPYGTFLGDPEASQG